MKIHIIGTVNGRLDEGMRNVATHIANAFQNEHEVYYSGLKNVLSIIKNSVTCDVTMIFARATKHVYWLLRVICLLSKQVWVVCVQKPSEDFIRLTLNAPLKVSYLAIDKQDLEQVAIRPQYRKSYFDLGISSQKFCPANTEKQKKLKAKYDIRSDKPLVIHVGHCSAGRGLEDFEVITDAEKLVIASGMFEHPDTVKALKENGVRIFKGYIENIEEIYQMADIYLLPTRSTEFIISVPLSVMEALSCGVPVIGYKEFSNLSKIAAEDGAIALIESKNELNDAVIRMAEKKRDTSYLKSAKTWEAVAEDILSTIKEG